MRAARAIATHTEREWGDLVRAHGRRCAYCDRPLGLLEVHKDHVIPVSRGGSDGIDNIVPACKPCNSEKHRMTADEYREYLSMLGRTKGAGWKYSSETCRCGAINERMHHFLTQSRELFPHAYSGPAA